MVTVATQTRQIRSGTHLMNASLPPGRMKPEYDHAIFT